MPPHPLAATPDAVILYDGECVFCQRSTRFIRQRDRRACFRFVALQSPEGQTLLARNQLPAAQPDSVVLIEGRRVSLRSTAILRICLGLSGAWPLLYAGIVLPQSFRDRLYNAVARRRNG